MSAPVEAVAAVLRDDSAVVARSAEALLTAHLSPEERWRLAILAVSVLDIEDQLDLADNLITAAAAIRRHRRESELP